MVWAAALLAAPATLSLSFGPAALSEFAPRLSELYGRPVRVDARLAREVVVVEAADVRSEALREQIANVVCGVWEEKDGILRLGLDPEKEAERRLEFDGKIGRHLRDVRRDHVNRMRAQAMVWTNEEVAAQWDDEQKVGSAPWSPVERAVGEAIGKLSDEEFGSWFRQVRFYYSDTAKPGVVLWGEEGIQKIRQGIAEEAALMRALRDRGIPVSDERPVFDPYNRPIAAPPRGRSWTVLIGHNHNPFAPPQSSHGRELRLQVFHVDEDGRLMGDPDIRLQGANWIEYDQIGLDFEPEKLPGAEKAFLESSSKSDDKEPLARLAGGGFARMARDTGRDICFCLPDSFIPAKERPLPHAEMIRDLGREPMFVSDRGGWLIGAPFDPIWSRDNRADRLDLAAYVKECESGETLTVLDRLNKPQHLRPITQDWKTDIATHLLGEKRSTKAGDVILGRLNDSTLRVLAEGRKIQFGALSKPERDAIWNVALQRPAYLFWELDGGFRNLIQRNEVLFGWPDGIPQDALMWLELEKIRPEDDVRQLHLHIQDLKGAKISFFAALPRPRR